MRAPVTLSTNRIKELLHPFYPEPTDGLIAGLVGYLEVLLLWNQKMNLTAIRAPEEIVVRHFGESLFASRYVPAGAATLLDVGSGAGFPGLPIKLVRPEVAVTLAESQGKKVAFLREISRVLQLEVEIWPDRVASLPASRRYDCVTLRAVDDPLAALAEGRMRVKEAGTLLQLTSKTDAQQYGFAVPGSRLRILKVEICVPRGTQAQGVPRGT